MRGKIGYLSPPEARSFACGVAGHAKFGGAAACGGALFCVPFNADHGLVVDDLAVDHGPPVGQWERLSSVEEKPETDRMAGTSVTRGSVVVGRKIRVRAGEHAGKSGRIRSCIRHVFDGEGRAIEEFKIRFANGEEIACNLAFAQCYTRILDGPSRLFRLSPMLSKSFSAPRLPFRPSGFQPPKDVKRFVPSPKRRRKKVSPRGADGLVSLGEAEGGETGRAGQRIEEPQGGAEELSAAVVRRRCAHVKVGEVDAELNSEGFLGKYAAKMRGTGDFDFSHLRLGISPQGMVRFLAHPAVALLVPKTRSEHADPLLGCKCQEVQDRLKVLFQGKIA